MEDVELIMNSEKRFGEASDKREKVWFHSNYTPLSVHHSHCMSNSICIDVSMSSLPFTTHINGHVS